MEYHATQHLSVVAIEKGVFGSPSIKVTNFTYVFIFTQFKQWYGFMRQLWLKVGLGVMVEIQNQNLVIKYSLVSCTELFPLLLCRRVVLSHWWGFSWFILSLDNREVSEILLSNIKFNLANETCNYKWCSMIEVTVNNSTSLGFVL